MSAKNEKNVNAETVAVNVETPAPVVPVGMSVADVTAILMDKSVGKAEGPRSVSANQAKALRWTATELGVRLPAEFCQDDGTIPMVIESDIAAAQAEANASVEAGKDPWAQKMVAGRAGNHARARILAGHGVDFQKASAALGLKGFARTGKAFVKNLGIGMVTATGATETMSFSAAETTLPAPRTVQKAAAAAPGLTDNDLVAKARELISLGFTPLQAFEVLKGQIARG
jgi:hypothetical protein